jgi:hypothetical protein
MLLYVCCDKDFKKGSIKTIVSETAGEGERPIRVTCAQDVFDELNKGVIFIICYSCIGGNSKYFTTPKIT